jgi:hypothetical protein
MRRVWVVRGGESNRLVDEFTDNGVVGVGYSTVPGDPGLSAAEVAWYLKEQGVSGIPDAHAAMFVNFVRGMADGDVVFMPDTPRGEVLVGEVAGPYRYEETLPVERYRHRRPVRWLGRVGLDDLPDEHRLLHHQRVTFAGKGSEPALLALADDVAAGDVGRPATDRRGRANHVGPARAAASPVRSERVCPACGLLRGPAVFPDGAEVCSDCT